MLVQFGRARAEFLNLRVTNTEPGPVATGFSGDIQCRMITELESMRHDNPVTTARGCVFVWPSLSGFD